MKRCKVTDLLSFLKLHGILPKRTLSQNFLVDENIVDKMLSLLHIEENDHILEIGPGAGALTQKLLLHKIHLTCVEKDDTLADLLQFEVNHTLSNEIIKQDILKWDLSNLSPTVQLKVISNLPYHITSKILKQLAKDRARITTCIVMVEKGYADDLMKSKDKHDATSFLLHLCFSITPVFTVSKNCFYPMPRIDSSVLQLTAKPPFIENEQHFIRLIEVLFQHKRKTIGSTLRHRFPQITQEDLVKIGDLASLRPEKLSPAEAFTIFDLYSDKLGQENAPYEGAND